jgi:hypothetical protein
MNPSSQSASMRAETARYTQQARTELRPARNFEAASSERRSFEPSPPPDPKTRPRQSSTALHSRVLKMLALVAIWFALAIWSLAGDPRIDYLRAIVIGFICAVLGLAVILGFTARKMGQAGADANGEPDFDQWAAGEFEILQGRVEGAEAAKEVLLPFVGMALAFTAFAVLSYLAG